MVNACKRNFAGDLPSEAAAASSSRSARSTRPQGLRVSRSSPRNTAPATATTSAMLANANASGRSASTANGRGMKAMPNGPPVMRSAFSATSSRLTAAPNVVMAR